MAEAKGNFTIRRGVCTAMFVFDVAMAIDLDAAERLAAGGPAGGSPHRGTLRPGGLIGSARKAPPYFEYRPAPVQVNVTGESIVLGGGDDGGAFATEAAIEVVLFDFGAVSVSYRIRLDGRPLGSLMDLSERLFDCAPLAADARARVSELSRQLAAAMAKPGLTDQVEDYCCYELQDVRDEGGAEAAPARVLNECGTLLARILRSERSGLSDEEIADALSCRVSYGPHDAAVIDWNAAVLLDREAEDVRAVLEFANVELLEMRFLDDRLDEILEDAYASLGRTKVGLKALFPSGSATVRRIAQLQMDSALLFENVNNALKLIGDQYLARVYRLAGQRFHLPERDQTIERKLSTLESIYTKLHDHEAGRRADLLTWTIILLIAFEIVMGLLSLGH